MFTPAASSAYPPSVERRAFLAFPWASVRNATRTDSVFFRRLSFLIGLFWFKEAAR